MGKCNRGAAKETVLLFQKQEEGLTFPFMDKFKSIIKDEWRQPEKNTFFWSRLAKLYPFKKEDVQCLEDPPVVDTALMRLARHVTLPLDDAVSFKDILDRRVDLDLKKR